MSLMVSDERGALGNFTRALILRTEEAI